MIKKVSTRKKKTIWVGLGALILCIIALLLPVWTITHLNVEGNVYYSKEDILKVAKVSEGMHLLELLPSKIKTRLKQLPYLKDVDHNYVFPGTFVISIKEAVPLGYVPFSGTYLVFDGDGQVLMQQSSTKGEFVLPVVEGLRFNRFTVGEKIVFENEDHFIIALEMIQSLSKYDYLEKVQVVDVANIEEIHLYVDRLDVIIGSMKDFEKKMEYLMEIHKEYTSGILDLSQVQKGEAILRPLH
jgi:cell division protein FtsQ